MAYDMYEVYFQIFTALAIVHVAISLLRCLISTCDTIDKQKSIDERLDVLEHEFIRLISGEYDLEPKNTIVQNTVVPCSTSVNKDDCGVKED